MKSNFTFIPVLAGMLAQVLSLCAQDRRPVPDTMPELRREAGRSADATLAGLRDSMGGRYTGEGVKDSAGGRVRAGGDTWTLQVFGDGTGAEFLDRAAAGLAHSTGVDPSKAISTDSLESAGRAYIERTLSKAIVLQRGERMVRAATSFRSEGGVARDGSAPYSAVTAARVVFSREIEGIPVVGAGSKVTITFLNDGTVESFRYDWPTYTRTANMQRLASAQEILRRVQRVTGTRAKSNMYQDLPAPASIEAISQPMRLGSDAQLQDLKCGYYDPGFANRSATAPVQAGCYYHVLHMDGQGEFPTTAGYSGAVPAAQSPARDASWPEETVLRNKKVKGRHKARSAGSGRKVRPVPPRPQY